MLDGANQVCFPPCWELHRADSHYYPLVRLCVCTIVFACPQVLMDKDNSIRTWGLFGYAQLNVRYCSIV